LAISTIDCYFSVTRVRIISFDWHCVSRNILNFFLNFIFVFFIIIIIVHIVVSLKWEKNASFFSLW
jgi:hypothetical protein